MVERYQNYVGGAWTDATSGDVSTSSNPADHSDVFGEFQASNSADADAAITAASNAKEGWRRTSSLVRGGYLFKAATYLENNLEEYAQAVTRESGKAILESRGEVGRAIALLQYYGVEGSNPVGTVVPSVNPNILLYTNRMPLGVISLITPWNFPLHQVMAKVAPALAVGCTVVLKPSEVAPLSAFLLAEMMDDLGFPPGVFNLVSGDGPVVGEAIAAHPDVDMVSFTGSTRAGTRVAEVAAVNVTRVHQELGGKSANIILDDADLSAAIPAAVGACFLNSGQTCSALTRLLVPADKMDEVAAIAGETAAGYTVGPADDDGSRLGPLVSAAQWEKVQGYIQTGIDEGATLVTGGTGKPDGLDAGYYVKPTVFADVSNSMTIAREEIFGPVLSIIGYVDVDDAIAIANDTEYGLAGGVWGTDGDKALAVAKRLRTGQVDMNGAFLNTDAPFGGYKKSGNGRELGRYGLAEFVESKSINLPMG